MPATDVAVEVVDVRATQWPDMVGEFKNYLKRVEQFHGPGFDAGAPPQDQVPATLRPIHFRYRTGSERCIRVDAFEHNSPNASYPPAKTWCFDGERWIYYLPEPSPTVVLSSSASCPNLGFAIGTCGSPLGFALQQQPSESTDPLSIILARAQAEGLVHSVTRIALHEHSDCIAVEVLFRRDPKLKQQLDVLDRLRMVFDPSLEMALVHLRQDVCWFAQGEMVQGAGAGGEALWEDFVKEGDGPPMARICTVRWLWGITEPVNGDAFSALLNGTESVTAMGLKIIDDRVNRVNHFHFGGKQYRITRIKDAKSEPSALCDLDFPEGTVVADTIHGDSYQLMGKSNKIDSAMRRPLLGGRDPVPAPPKSWPTWWILAGNVAVVVVLLFVVWRARMR